MHSTLASPFTFNAQPVGQQQPTAQTATFGVMSGTHALSNASAMAIRIPSSSRKRSRDDLDEGEQQPMEGDDSSASSAFSRKLAAPRAAIGNPALAQWVELDAAENQSTLASLGLLPSHAQGNGNLFAQRTPVYGSYDSAFSAEASTSAGTPAMTGSPSSLYSEIPGMPATPSDAHSALPRSTMPGNTFHTPSVGGPGYFDKAPHKQRAASTSSNRPCGILEPQLGLSGTDVAMDGSSAAASSSHGPWCKSIPQLSVRADGTGSELWARCRDCGAFDKVNPTAFNSQPIAYSP